MDNATIRLECLKLARKLLDERGQPAAVARDGNPNVLFELAEKLFAWTQAGTP